MRRIRNGAAALKRVQDTIRGSRIQPLVVQPAPRKYPPQRMAEHERRKKLKVEADKFMLRMGLALVSMQEQELDENGHREQSPDVPDWRKVAKFAAPEPPAASTGD